MSDGGYREALGAALHGLACYAICEIPRRDDAAAGREPADAGRGQRAAALTAAYHAGIAGIPGISAPGGPGTLAFGWVRLAAGGPVRVIVAGEALAGGTGEDGDVLLALPAGARGAGLTAVALGGLIRGLGCWREVAGISDGLLAADGDRPPGAEAATRGRVSLDEVLLGSWTGAFGWLVLAEPVPPGRLTALAEEAGRRQRLAEASADRFPERAAQARRLKERQAEFQRGLSSGFWRITVAAGGTDAAGAARVAGLLCASADLAGLPYALSPALAPPPGPAAAGPNPAAATGATGVTASEPGGDGLPAAPFYGSTALLAALARPPEAEVPGVRFPLRPDFDVTPEAPAAGTDAGAPGIGLGEVLDRNLRPAGPFNLAPGSLNRHVFVC